MAGEHGSGGATYSAAALCDLHARTHQSLTRLLAHCETLPPAAIDRGLEGFGYPSVRLQLHHVIGAEQYWIGVLQGRVEAEMDDAAYPSIAALAAYREHVFAATREYLESASERELNTPRPMVTWGGREQVLMPARVVLRTQTHVFQHQGQVVAMCRLLGSPVGGLDFPIV